MSEIKSAFEIAMERINQMGDATPEEKLKWKYDPVGQKIAMQFLKDEIDIKTALNEYESDGIIIIKKAIQGVLLDQLVLPNDGKLPPRFNKALAGIIDIKNDKDVANQVASGLNQLMDHYVTSGTEQRKQATEMLKQTFANKLRSAATSMNQTIDTSAINVESLPQFKEELSKLLVQIDEQYQMQLTQFKEYLANLD